MSYSAILDTIGKECDHWVFEYELNPRMFTSSDAYDCIVGCLSLAMRLGFLTSSQYHFLCDGYYELVH